MCNAIERTHLTHISLSDRFSFKGENLFCMSIVKRDDWKSNKEENRRREKYIYKTKISRSQHVQGDPFLYCSVCTQITLTTTAFKMNDLMVMMKVVLVMMGR